MKLSTFIISIPLDPPNPSQVLHSKPSMHLTLFLIHYTLPSKMPNSFQAVHTNFSTVLH